MAMRQPEFMKEKNWYYFDDEECFVHRLTKYAPEEVYQSYKIYLEDCLINEQIDELDYEYLLEELENIAKEKVNNLFGV